MPTVDLKIPPVSWPTVLLAIGVVATWTVSAAAHAAGLAPWWATLAISSWAAFAAFTPLHDATHRSVGRSPWLNAVVGRVCGVLLMGPFPAFRHFHLQHHRHTNDPELDPDHWAGRGPLFVLPLRWLSQDLHYLARYVSLRGRPRAEQVETWAMELVFIGLAVVGLASPWWETVLVAWVVPARLGIAMLAFAFDYLPHWPHAVRASEDRFGATVVLRERWLTLPLLWQNYHLVHHLYPAVPFHRYGKVWVAKRAELVAKGALEVSVFDRREGLGAPAQPGSARAEAMAP